MRRFLLLSVVAFAVAASSASAQLPGLRKRDAPAQSMLQGIDALRADFATRSGTNTIYFVNGSAVIGAPATATLQAQAVWLRQHPEVAVRIEGYGDTGDTSDHALAMGARRAEEVRDYLMLLGVPAAQLSTTTWGNQRPGAGRTITVLASVAAMQPVADIRRR
jgi:peptidoglycan-associated lipoprotein